MPARPATLTRAELAGTKLAALEASNLELMHHAVVFHFAAVCLPGVRNSHRHQEGAQRRSKGRKIMFYVSCQCCTVRHSSGEMLAGSRRARITKATKIYV